MIRTAILALVALANILVAAPAVAQAYQTGPQTPVWVDNPVIGDGVDRFPEISTVEQGGDPPALAFEPAAIDTASGYVRDDWSAATGGAGYTASTQPKARFTCNWSHFAVADPMLFPGQANTGHHHTFIGNESVDHNSTYATLRNNPRSTCAGGPANATGYWEPTLFYERSATVHLPLKPNVVTFYYTIADQSMSAALYRLLRGLAFIGGVDPSDRLNTARLAEIPDGQGWLKTKRYNGWNGWGCFNGGTIVPATNATDTGGLVAGYSRQLVNPDGSDPWAGQCEASGYLLIASMSAPSCWDGKNLTSPNGRNHFRYPILKSANQQPTAEKCPDGWWKVPHFEVKSEFANGRPGIVGHAWRSKLYLSSDRHGLAQANWHPRGSTFHFDWMNGWDSTVLKDWLTQCVGVQIDGTPGATPLNGLGGFGNDCNASTISATRALKIGTPPTTGLSNNPIITNHDYSVGPSKQAFGKPVAPVKVTITADHAH